MSLDAQNPWRTPTLIELGEQFERLAQDQQTPAPAPPHRPAAGWRAAGALAILAAALIVGFTLVLTQRASRAQADVRGAAAAAEKARTFNFQSTSVLSIDGQSRQSTNETGTVDLATPAYRVRIVSGEVGRGFERIVFTHALYVQPFRGKQSFAWSGVRLHPAAAIAPRAGASSGVADPLGLLAVLSKSKGAMRVGTQQVSGVATIHYRLSSTLEAFLLAQGEHVALSADVARSPVLIDVWLDAANRVRLASRQFQLGGSHNTRLQITTSFDSYGSPVRLSTPAGVNLAIAEPLNRVAADPVSASLLVALKLHSRHPATPAIHPQKH